MDCRNTAVECTLKMYYNVCGQMSGYAKMFLLERHVSAKSIWLHDSICSCVCQCEGYLKFSRKKREYLLKTHDFYYDLPEELMDYVTLHELVHFVHPDHGPGFYGLMDRLMPDWRQRRKELRRYGGALAG